MHTVGQDGARVHTDKRASPLSNCMSFSKTFLSATTPLDHPQSSLVSCPAQYPASAHAGICADPRAADSTPVLPGNTPQPRTSARRVQLAVAPCLSVPPEGLAQSRPGSRPSPIQTNFQAAMSSATDRAVSDWAGNCGKGNHLQGQSWHGFKSSIPATVQLPPLRTCTTLPHAASGVLTGRLCHDV